MNKVIIFAIITILFSCSNQSQDNKLSPTNNHAGLYMIDTILGNYATKIVLENHYFKKGVENEVKFDINNVSKDDLIIYTKTSEATTKINIDTTGFLILPTLTADTVTVFINIRKNGEMISIGKINIKTV